MEEGTKYYLPCTILLKEDTKECATHQNESVKPRGRQEIVDAK